MTLHVAVDAEFYRFYCVCERERSNCIAQAGLGLKKFYYKNNGLLKRNVAQIREYSVYQLFMG